MQQDYKVDCGKAETCYMIFVLFALFALSTIGWWEIVRRHCAWLDVSFIPGLTIAVQSTLLFGAGLLNILSEATFILYGVGFLGVIYSIQRGKGIQFIKTYICVPILFLTVSMIVMGLGVKGCIFTQYDGFSHWSLVLKQILKTNRFPNYLDTLILFQEYPVGSATFIYFVCKLTTANDESIQMLAQIYMIIASVLPLFSLCKKNWLFTAILLVAFTNFALVYNNRVVDLTVDTLLPLVSMGALMYALSYCGKSCGYRQLFPFVFYMIQIVQIKNAGIFFLAVISVLLLIKADRKTIIHRLACIALPIISIILWHKHCQYVFDASTTTKHAMTISNYSNVLGEKTAGGKQVNLP